MTQHILDPISRMKAQRGRHMDSPAPVMYVPAPERTGGIRWRLIAFTGVASAAAALICAAVASFVV